MDGEGIGKTLEAFVDVANKLFIILLLLLPFALWKIFDVLWWTVSHLRWVS